MALTEVNLAKLKNEAKGYDYLRFTWCSLHGIPQAKIVPACDAEKFLEDGVTSFSGVIAMGPGNEIIDIKEVTDHGCPNVFFKPVGENIVHLPWSTEGKFKVGEVMCEAFTLQGDLLPQNPRCIARKQLEKLKGLGFKLLSATENECIVADKETMTPIFDCSDYLKIFSFAKYETMFYEFDQLLRKSGVAVESFHTECSPGQVEFVLRPQFGLEAADHTFFLRRSLKEMFDSKGFYLTSMTRPFASNGCSNGTHFNFSLWSLDGEKNMFYDDTKPDKLSEIALYFIGGFLKHVRALTALCCPTWNCYRRLHNPWAPCFGDYELDHRFVTLRVKNYSHKGTYMENRLPSGSSNPYIVLAATLAAGVDGIANKILPPKRGKGDKSSSAEIPHTLEQAVDALKEDKYMAEALGKEFIEWFLICIEQIDYAKFKNHDVKQAKAEEIEVERKEFGKFL